MQADKYQLQTMEKPRTAFAKVSADLIVELPTSHYNSNNILAMVEHLTGWPIAKAIPNKEATALRNSYLNMAHMKFIFLTMVRSSPMTLWPMCIRSSILNSILQAPTHPGQIKTENFNKFLKASIRKLCQEDTAAWDQVLDQILFTYKSCPHKSTGEAPYTLLHNRDPLLPVQKLIKCTESYKGESMLGKRMNSHGSLFPLQQKCWRG